MNVVIEPSPVVIAPVNHHSQRKIPEEELSDMYDEADADGGSVTLIFTTGYVFLYQKGNSTMIYND